MSKQPTEEAILQARSNPGGWVYEIVGRYNQDDAVPPEAIAGAWKVDETGNIIGEFIPNPRFGMTKPPIERPD